MSPLDQLKALLKKNHLWAKKSLGQNFLVDEKVLNTIVGAAELESTDQVIEVGPGTGLLTEKLIEKVNKLLAIELDLDMVHVLEERFKAVKNLNIINEDILKLKLETLKLEQYKVVANIPYYITSPLIKHFLHAPHPPELIVLLVQKEVAEKIAGREEKTLLTVEIEVFGHPEIIAYVTANSFYPVPKVDSAILRIRPYENPLVPINQQEAFFRLVKFGYSQKRKKLSNTLAAGLQLKPFEVGEKMKSIGINPDLRAEHLNINEWRKLMDLFKNLLK